MLETEIIVLKKIHYGETSLIVNGFSVDSGRFDLLLKGGAKSSAKKFPVIDLFREVKVQYKNEEKELHAVYNAELINQFDALSSKTDNFDVACKMSSFLMKNLQPALPCPNTYYVFRNILGVLSQNESFFDTGLPDWNIDGCRIMLLICFLEENGLLPEQLGSNSEDDMKQRYLLNTIIEAGAEGAPLPPIDSNYQKRLLKWLGALCNYHNLNK